jgi:hypothetical protein
MTVSPYGMTMPLVSMKGTRNLDSVLVVLADLDAARVLITVRVGDGEDQMVDLHHHQRLNQIPVDRVPHPRAASLHFEPAAPFGVKSVDQISELRDTVLAKEHGPFDSIMSALTELDLEPDIAQSAPDGR